jgi:hypothetical protein
LAIRYSDSPRKEPPKLVVIWSLRDGGVVSPATSHTALAAKAAPIDSQKSRPLLRARP